MSAPDTIRPVRRALISVSDKSGLVELGRFLAGHGIEILSTGGSAQLLRDNGVAVTGVSDYTGFPELMDGRVKTLHPRIHGGILGRRGADDEAMAAHDIPPIDLVVVNLYPFERTIANPGCSFADAIENIDIGGPTLLRAAAKNHESVSVLVEHEDHAVVCGELTAHGGVRATTRRRLATTAFAHCARYDGAIANYLSARTADGAAQSFPGVLNLQFARIAALRYGENPHQQAAFYRAADAAPGELAHATLHQGKALSYNNIADADSAWQCVNEFAPPACVIVKHANPCGVACGAHPGGAYDDAWRTDPTSAFGGVIAFNRALDAATAKTILERQFVEVIVAPQVEAAALEALAAKPAVRVLDCGGALDSRRRSLLLHRVSGGLLAQDNDAAEADDDCTVAGKRHPDDTERADALFAWRVAKHVKSNAIVYARHGATLGIGAGQPSRIDAVRIAADKAHREKLELDGAAMASDAFFPFRDGLDAAAEHGIRTVIEPGGSVRDDEVIKAADEHGMALLFTGVRHFRH